MKLRRNFTVFLPIVNARSNLAGIIKRFWSRGTWPSAESPDRGPRRNAHYTCTVKGREKFRACAFFFTKHQIWDSVLFCACAISCQKTTSNVMGSYHGSVNGTTKNPGFLDFGFCQMLNWAYINFHNILSPPPPPFFKAITIPSENNLKPSIQSLLKAGWGWAMNDE